MVKKLNNAESLDKKLLDENLLNSNLLHKFKCLIKLTAEI